MAEWDPLVIFLVEGQWNARQLFTRPVICMWAKQSCWESRLLSILMRKEALQKAGRTSCLCCSSHSPQQQSSEKHLLLGWWGRNWSQPWDMKPVPRYTTAEPTASPDRSFCLETTIRGLTRPPEAHGRAITPTNFRSLPSVQIKRPKASCWRAKQEREIRHCQGTQC